MSGPGDRATKRTTKVEPTLSTKAEGHGASPKRADVGSSLHPGSKGSARSDMLPAREPGDLGGASSSMVDGRQRREGPAPQSAQYAFEKSDAGMVPKKSAKTRVTPVESAEGKAAAEGKSTARNVSPATKPTWTMERRAVAIVQEALPTAAPSYRPSLAYQTLRRPLTQGGSPVREIRSPGSVRGAARKGRPYRDRRCDQARLVRKE